jgi:hypothetical protein
VHTVCGSGGENKPVRTERPDGRQCVVHGGLFQEWMSEGVPERAGAETTRHAGVSTEEVTRPIADTRSEGVRAERGVRWTESSQAALSRQWEPWRRTTRSPERFRRTENG